MSPPPDSPTHDRLPDSFEPAALSRGAGGAAASGVDASAVRRSLALLSVTSFLEHIACGRVDTASRRRLLACRLIPAKKKDGGVRPIAVSEVFLRAASFLSLRLLPAGGLSRLLAPLQLGIGAAAG